LSIAHCWSLLRDTRREQGEQRSLLLSLVEYARKPEQRLDQTERRLHDRIISVRDDLELMLKAQLIAKLTHFETRIDERLAELESRS
jgi:hypothetical protein